VNNVYAQTEISEISENISESSVEVYDKTHIFTNDFSVNYSTVYADCVFVDEDQDGKVVIGSNTLKYCSYHYKIVKAVKVPDKFSIKAYNSKVNLDLSLDYVQYNASDMKIYFYARGSGEFNVTCEGCLIHDPNVTACGTTLTNGLYYELNASLSCTGHGITFANNNTLDCKGFTIDGDDTGSDWGLYLNYVQNNTIRNCIIKDFLYGIYLVSSSNNILTNNTANTNMWVGILLEGYSSNNILTNNTANTNTWDGIYLEYSLNNTITNNTANTNDLGIYLWSSSNNTITNNTANSNNYYGILLGSSSNNILTNNTANTNKASGIYLEDSSNNTLTSSTANTNNDTGILLGSSSNNILTNNTANTNNDTGIRLEHSSNNNTLINNTANTNKASGIYLEDSSNNSINTNLVCNNTNIDLYSSDWLSSSGDNNTCDKPGIWNDTGTTGCTYLCTGYVNDCNCSSCDECNYKLNSSCDLVTLADDIINNSGTCIYDPVNFINKVFDCQGYMINGSGYNFIYRYNASNISIKNCVIMGFGVGFYFEEGGNNIFLNNTIINNSLNGVVSLNSGFNLFDGNYICGNAYYDFYSLDWLNSSGVNNTCQVPDGWNDFNVSGCSFLCYNISNPENPLEVAAADFLRQIFYLVAVFFLLVCMLGGLSMLAGKTKVY
jgi:parallel beta-helix repeat protein